MMVHLHVRSAYTLLDSTLKIEDIVHLAKENLMDAIALSDHNVLYGVMAFFHACQREGIKPIIAMEVDCLLEGESYNLLLYAKSDVGYQQLMKLSTWINTHPEKLTFEQLKEYDEDWIVVNAYGDAYQGFVEQIHHEEAKEKVKRFLALCQDAFHEFYASIAMNDDGLLGTNQDYVIACAQKLGIKTVALSRIYYAEKEDEDAYRMLRIIAAQKDDVVYETNRYFRSEQEMETLYRKEDLDQTVAIANQCNVMMAFDKANLPHYENRYGVDSSTFLTSLCRRSLQKRLEGRYDERYAQRLEYELKVIIDMGYADYFLIVYDFIHYARKQDIYVGPGRGSAAGSLVAYCLGITQVDPIQYHLLFERFLNPERVSMPDIDTDFPDDRRNEVIAYVAQKYGKSHTAHIVAFNTLKAKQALRVVGKALHVAPSKIDMIAKMVKNDQTLQEAFASNPAFQSNVTGDRDYRRMYQISLKIEGLPRNLTTHAAGIVLSNRNITDVCPLVSVDDLLPSTQFTMGYMEELGLIKMDFLGLRNLTILNALQKDIRMVTNHAFAFAKIALDDANTYELICQGDTLGIFQLESQGMRQLLAQLQPRDFESLSAAIALYRPGPMDNIPAYLENRKHPEKIKYIHENLKPILENTYGIMVYQEQIMQIAQKMAGFSLGKADLLRRAISKKDATQMETMRTDFMTGSLRNGYAKETAVEVYEQILKFANYGFNKAHAIAYAIVAYHLAYAKANYPLLFYKSFLNSVKGSEVKTGQTIYEARKRNIPIFAPSVNRNAISYEIDGQGLRVPLTSIRDISVQTATAIAEERNQHGRYVDYIDFMLRIHAMKLERSWIFNLIDAGALDDFGLSRLTMKDAYEKVVRYAKLVVKEDNQQVRFDFDVLSRPSIEFRKDNERIRSEREKAVLGFYISTHPITLMRRAYPSALSLIEALDHKDNVQILCIIASVKEHRDKRGQEMAFLTIKDETTEMEAVCFSSTYRYVQGNIHVEDYAYVQGKMDHGKLLIRKLTLVAPENE